MFKTISASIACIFIVISCAHNETFPERAPSSTVHYASGETGSPRWDNDVCVLKGESREQDFIIRFNDVHSLCPQLRDYNPAGVAYTKLKNQKRGIYIPACKPLPAEARMPASRCWIGFDVFGQNAGSCHLTTPQTACTSCQCDGRSGIAWQN